MERQALINEVVNILGEPKLEKEEEEGFEISNY